MTEYVFRHEPQSAPRITHVEVPAGFSKALDAQWKLVQKDQINPVIDFSSAKEAAFHLAYAKEWGRNQTPEVTVRKGTLRANDQEGTLRLLMTPFDPNAPKRGRKAKAESETTPGNAPVDKV
jgi:hypothetical protein